MTISTHDLNVVRDTQCPHYPTTITYPNPLNHLYDDDVPTFTDKYNYAESRNSCHVPGNIKESWARYQRYAQHAEFVANSNSVFAELTRNDYAFDYTVDARRKKIQAAAERRALKKHAKKKQAHKKQAHATRVNNDISFIETYDPVFLAETILGITGPITTMKLHKLMYYAQAWHLAWDGKPIIDNRVEAWANGPVFPDLHSICKGRFIVYPKQLWFMHTVRTTSARRIRMGFDAEKQLWYYIFTDHSFSLRSNSGDIVRARQLCAYGTRDYNTTYRMARETYDLHVEHQLRCYEELYNASINASDTTDSNTEESDDDAITTLPMNVDISRCDCDTTWYCTVCQKYHCGCAASQELY